MDETVLMKKTEDPQRGLEDTQSMPKVDASEAPLENPRQGRSHGTVRELDPLPEKRLQGRGARSSFWTKRRKRNAVLAGGFLLALLLGFFFAGYAQHQTDAREEQARIQQEQAAKQAKDAASLEKQKAELEQKKQELEAKKQELLLQAARAEGKNEQLAEDQGSMLGKLVDKVTGQEKKQQQAKAANAAEQDSSKQAAQQVDEAITQAGQMLDDVNEKINQNGKLQETADTVRTGAQSAYEDHKDTIDSVASYVADGAKLVFQRLFL